jgi:hypothetical protein
LCRCGCSSSQSIVAWNSARVPDCVASPAWMRISPSGSLGLVLGVSDMQTTAIGLDEDSKGRTNRDA